MSGHVHTHNHNHSHGQSRENFESSMKQILVNATKVC